MLELITGNIGEGKTILAVYNAWKLHNWNLEVPKEKRFPIYTNFNLGYGEVERITVSDLLRFEGLKNGLMITDEGYTQMESRISGYSKLGIYVSYFIFQSRKRRVDVIVTAQLGSTIDLRFYDLANIVVLARKNDDDKRFEYQEAVRTGWSDIRVVTSYLSFEDASKFWNDYDTDEPVAPLGLKELQFAVDRYDTKRINARVDALVERALPLFKPFGVQIYHYQIEDWLLRIGEPLPLARFVCNRLKSRLRAE